MTRTWELVLIWLAACLIAVVSGYGLLNVMLQEADISWSTQLPRSVVTVPMFCVIVFWGVVRMAGVRLQPVTTFTFGGLAVYFALFAVGRILVGFNVDPALVLLIVSGVLMGLAWWAIRQAARRTPRKRRPLDP